MERAPLEPRQDPSNDEALLQSFEREDARREAEVQKAVDELGEILTKTLKQLEDKESEAFLTPHLFEQKETPEQPKTEAKLGPDVMRLGDAQLRESLKELLVSRKIDVVLEHYSGYRFAQKELFERPFYEALEKIGLAGADNEDQLAEALNRRFTPGYAEMSPETQAALCEAVKPLISGVIEALREKWYKDVFDAVSRKIEALTDNLAQLEDAKSHKLGRAFQMHEATIVQTRRMIDNAQLLLASFEEPDQKTA